MRRLGWWLAVVAVVVGGAGEARAQRWEWEATSGLYSQNRFRGLRQGGFGWISETTLRAGLAGGLTAHLSGLTAQSFSKPSGHLENRLNLGLGRRVGPLMTVVGGWQWLDRAGINPLYPGQHELYLGLEAEVAGFRPMGYLYLDVTEGSGLYALAAVSRTWALGEQWSLGTLGAMGFASGRYDGFQNALLSFDLNYPVARGLELGPRLDLHFPSTQADPSADGFRAVVGFGVRYRGGF